MKRFLVFFTDSSAAGYEVLGSFDSLREVAAIVPYSYSGTKSTAILDMHARVWWDAEWEHAAAQFPLTLTKRTE